MYGEFLDDRVGQEFGGKLGNLLLRRRAGQVDLEALPLADRGHLLKSEPSAGTGNRLALRVVDLRLEHDIDDEFRHIPNSTRPVVGGVRPVFGG